MNYCFINRWKTPDGTILESRHGWDYQTHVDTVTGEWYMCDGVGYMIRTSVNEVPMQNLCVTSEDDFEKQRTEITWGSYGKSGKETKRYIPIKDLTDQHIGAILKTQWHIKGKPIEEIFIKELAYRKLNNITIEEV